MTIAIGFEGSANKLGIGIIQDQNILSNIRHTYITPPGEDYFEKAFYLVKLHNIIENIYLIFYKKHWMRLK